MRLTREEQQERTRSALLDAAVEVFAELGYHGATVEAITERAGYTRGAFYSNFQTKEQLFLELFRLRSQERIDEIREVLSTGGRIEDRVQAAGRQWSGILAKDPAWVLLLLEFWTYAARTPSVREEFSRIDREFRAAVGDMIAAQAEALGAQLPMPGEDLAKALIGLASGIALQELADPDHTSPELYERVLGLVIRGMPYVPIEAEIKESTL